MIRLAEELRRLHPITATQPLVIAVSGGVDSVALAMFAQRTLGGAHILAVHASGPAVPADAAPRLQSLAAAHGLPLRIVDAGEINDDRYVANPANRCYYCKSDLYAALVRLGPVVVSGTNVDDLSDHRPGLRAATEAGVHHPFVAAGMGKRDVRALALELGLPELAALPSSPCLSSRVETGIRIDAAMLAAIDDVERFARQTGLSDVRCRVRSTGIVVEHGSAVTPDAAITAFASSRFAPMMTTPPSISFAAYRRGSAFLHIVTDSAEDNA
jgi:pyridinium-3,5-biscarboxylic acid mononucleotide sulfurtransferase